MGKLWKTDYFDYERGYIDTCQSTEPDEHFENGASVSMKIHRGEYIPTGDYTQKMQLESFQKIVSLPFLFGVALI